MKQVRFFGKYIYPGKFNVREAEIDQTNLLENMMKCNNKSIIRFLEAEMDQTNLLEKMIKCNNKFR